MLTISHKGRWYRIRLFDLDSTSTAVYSVHFYATNEGWEGPAIEYFELPAVPQPTDLTLAAEARRVLS